MNKKQILTEYIQKEIPEIMELKKDCKLTYDNKTSIIIGKVINRSPIEKKSEYRYQMIGGEDNFGAENIFSIYETGLVNISHYKIIGREINLEDILGVLDSSLEVENVILKIINKTFYIKLAGGMRCVDIEWTPNTPLHLQSQETIEFLYDLLIKK